MALYASNRHWRTAPHLNYLNRKLYQIDLGEIDRLAIFMPPRHGKSTLTSHYFPASYLGRHPDNRVILASYAANFASEWGRKARDVLTEFGPSVFQVQVRSDSSAADRWDIAGRRGGMTTAGVGGPITGRGANLLIIDDPVKNEEEARSALQREKMWDWYQATANTRMEPDGAQVLIMTRWHRDDLGGRILTQAQEKGRQWEVITLPGIAKENDLLGRQPGEALWPSRFPEWKLRQIQEEIGAYWWGCLYDQNPGAEGGAEWPDSYFGPGIWFDEWPRELTIKTIALDPSKGKDAKFGDYRALVQLGRDSDGTLWCEADLAREPTPLIVASSIELQRRFQADGFAVETNQFQELLAMEIIEESKKVGIMLPVVPIENMVNKEVRIRQLGPYLAKGNIRFKGGSPGTKLLVQQLRDFPNGDHDDGPDALQMALRVMIQLWNGRHASNVAGRLAV